MSNIIQFPRGGMSAIVRKAAADQGVPVVEVRPPASLVAIPIPGYMTRKGQLGVAFTDTETGVSWCYSHTGYYVGHWAFHAPKDEPDAYYGTGNSYVPQHVKDAAAPIIATFPPLPEASYGEDYV